MYFGNAMHATEDEIQVACILRGTKLWIIEIISLITSAEKIDELVVKE